MIYAATAFGIGIDIHYCKGKISTISIVGFGKSGCRCNGKMNNDCCKDEMHFYKADNHKTQSTASVIIPFEIVKPQLYFIDSDISLLRGIADENKLPDSNKIKLRYSNSLFIPLQVFRV